MAVGGTVGTPIWVKDGQYLSFEVETAAVTLGNVVAISSAGKVCPGTAALVVQAIGVAVSANKQSRTATDGQAAVGELVTVATRGVVNVTTDNSGILIGSLVEAIDTGIVGLHTAADSEYNKVLGIALEPNGSAATVIKIKLLRG